jgi:hypothetical protein
MSGIVLCNENLTGSCEYCKLVVGHRPLCVINLRMLRSMAENIERDMAKMTRRQNQLAENLKEVHEAVLANPPRMCPHCGKARPPTGGAYCSSWCEQQDGAHRRGG